MSDTITIPDNLDELREKLASAGLAVDPQVYQQISRESLVYGIVERLTLMPTDILRFLFRTVFTVQRSRPDSAGWLIMQKAGEGDNGG